MQEDNIEELVYSFSLISKYLNSSKIIDLRKKFNFIVESIKTSEEKPKNREITYDDLWNGVSEV